MYEINYAYSELDNSFRELSPETLIAQMFDKTDEKGVLLVPAHPYRAGKYTEGRKWLRCVMEWTSGDRDRIIKEFDDLYNALAEIAAASPELGESSAENEEVLSPAVLDIWRIYCTDLGDGLFEKELERSIDGLIDRELFPELEPGRGSRRAAERLRSRHRVDIDPLPADEEMFLYWKHNFDLKADIRTRYGSGPFAFDVCIRMKRLYYLLVFDAPESLIDREAKRLAKYMVLDRYCISSNEVELLDAYALPLTGIRNVELVRDILADIALYDIVDPENDTDPEVVNWDSICYKKADRGEELIEQYNLFTRFESGSHILAEALARDAELDPAGIEFYGVESSALLGNGWPDFIYYPEMDGARKNKTGRIREKDILDTLVRFAGALGIEAGLAGVYPIPM